MSIRETHSFPSESEARAFGESFKQGWGWGYDPSFSVYQDSTGQWVCYTSRAGSCD